MKQNPYFNRVLCLECGNEMAADMHAAICEKCGSPWLDAQYDYKAVSDLWSAPLTSLDQTLWRYHDLLPIVEPHPDITMGEGYTPLLRLRQYERLFNKATIYIKDERSQPTNSFKDRQAALSVNAMMMNDVKETVLASTGNAGVAYAAFTARAGIKLWLFLTSMVPPEKMREAALYGAQVVKVSGTYDETKHVAAQFAQHKGIPMDKGAKTIPSKESMKTLAFEIAEQLGLVMGESGEWKAPDWYIQAVSGGIGPIGVWKGFEELHKMGLIDKMPKLGIIQAMGCSPMVTAHAAGKDKADAVVPRTLIHVLATGDPGFAYTQLHNAAVSNGGAMIAVEDGETFSAMRHLATRAGISVEPATAVAFAGLEKMLTDDIIKDDEVVVVNCSGHTLPAESHILGDQYDRYILDLKLADSEEKALEPEEGLGAALKRLDEQVTTIVIIDDNVNDRRLIRRLLQSHKQYRVYEASNGEQGMQVIYDRKPDLIVLDLTMPKMDGFAVMEKLKNDPQTANIPIVVVSAKSLTPADKFILDEYTESVWEKGGFDTRQLVDHVVQKLGHTPVGVIQREKHESTRKDEQPTEPNSNQPVIVMIEDNPKDLRLARKMLETAGDFFIVEAMDGRTGLKAIYNYHPDLIVLDLMLPDVDGFSILETLEKDEKLRDIPVVIVSAKSLNADEHERLIKTISSIIEKASLDRRKFISIIKDNLR